MSKPIIINKFGGGILKNELFPIIAKRLNEQLKKGYFPIVVVSAFPGITDQLLSVTESSISNIKNIHFEIIDKMNMNLNYSNIAKIETEKVFNELEIIVKNIKNTPEIELSVQDKIVSFGEKLSTVIINQYFNSAGIKSKKFFAEEVPIITDDNFKNANIAYDISVKNILNKISNSEGVPVIAGFTGITLAGHTTTLGRGGTDTTACFVGSALKALKIILWKDVGGVLSADPKIVNNAKTISSISYLEAEESGKIIHDKAIQYVKINKTTVEITSIANPKLKTEIKEIKKVKKGAKIVSVKNDLSLILITDENIKVNDLLFTVSQTFIKYKVDIILISNTRYSLQIVANNSNSQLDKVYEELKTKIAEIEITKASMVYLVGLFDAKDVSNLNDLLVKQKANLLISAFYYENCYRIEAVIKTNDINNIIKAVHKKFIK